MARACAVATAALLALCACASSDEESDAETALILQAVPVGTPFKQAEGAMQALGFSCASGHMRLTDSKGNVREAEPHLLCEREERVWLACIKRTRSFLLQRDGRLSNVLVSVGRFC